MHGHGSRPSSPGRCRTVDRGRPSSSQASRAPGEAALGPEMSSTESAEKRSLRRSRTLLVGLELEWGFCPAFALMAALPRPRRTSTATTTTTTTTSTATMAMTQELLASLPELPITCVSSGEGVVMSHARSEVAVASTTMLSPKSHGETGVHLQRATDRFERLSSCEALP